MTLVARIAISILGASGVTWIAEHVAISVAVFSFFALDALIGMAA